MIDNEEFHFKSVRQEVKVNLNYSPTQNVLGFLLSCNFGNNICYSNFDPQIDM